MGFFARVLFLLGLLFSIEAERSENHLLLVISLDGFRYDYLDRYSNPNGFLRSLAQAGFRAAWSESIFPSNTYPNHWSIVTGLYAESHGIVNNEVYDPHKKLHFRMTKDMEDSPGWFQDAEPVWITNQKVNQARDKHSVVFDWPGAPAVFDGIQPRVFRQITHDNWFLNTFNDTIEKFAASVERGRTNLAFLYLGEPDMAGHYHGPESKEVESTVKELDYVLEKLFKLLALQQKFNIDEEVDVLIVTDHGMATIREPNEDTLKRHVYLSDYIDVKKHLLLDKCTYGSVSELWLKDEQQDLDFIYQKLVLAKDEAKIKGIYLKKDIPERFNLNRHDRVAPLILLAKTGYQIILERDNAQKYSVSKYHGNHGFEPNDVLMRGTFIAKGRSFKQAHQSTKQVNLIDYYALICHLLSLTPNSNNGSLSRISHILAVEPPNSDNDDLMQTLLMCGIIFIVLLVLFSFVMPSFLIMSSVKLTCDQPPSDIQPKFQRKPKKHD